MARRPRITLPPSIVTPRVEVPRRPAPRPSAGRPPPASATPAQQKRKAQQAIARIKRRLRSADAEFFAVGKELLALDRPQVFAAFGVTTFAEFLDAHVMPFGTAQRYMAVAEEYPEALALQLGVEKGFQLVQYAAVADTRMRARTMAERDVRIGKPPQPISALSALDLRNLVQTLKLGAARAALPKATRRETRVARAAANQLEELLGVDAKVRIDKARDVVRFEVRLSELLD